MSQPAHCMRFLGQIPSKCSTRSATCSTLLHHFRHPNEAPPDCPSNANSSKPVARLANQFSCKTTRHLNRGPYLATETAQNPPQPPPQRSQHPIEDGNTMQFTHTIPASNLQGRAHPQQRPQPSRSFTTIPYTIETKYPTHLFRVLIVRRMLLPIPFAFARWS